MLAAEAAGQWLATKSTDWRGIRGQLSARSDEVIDAAGMQHSRGSWPMSSRGSRFAFAVAISLVAQSGRVRAQVADSCPATDLETLSPSGSVSGDTTGYANDYEADGGCGFPCAAGGSNYGSAGRDGVVTFQVGTSGTWTFS